MKGASFFGIGQGTARGGVPSARIAAYKVCYPSGCDTQKVLAAFDDAIADGVDIITISLGATSATPLANDEIGIGAFHAMAKGILTVNSAGNSGPEAGFTSSIAPWLMSVAASTIDPSFVDNVVLGNGKTVAVCITVSCILANVCFILMIWLHQQGHSINSFTMKGKKFPLVYGKGVSNSSFCTLDSAR